MSDAIAGQRDDSPTLGLPARRRSRPSVWTARRLGLALAPFFLLLFTAGLWSANALPWIQMWSLAAALLFGLKWLTFIGAWSAGSRPTRARILAYFLAWPGTDADAFFGSDRIVSRPSRHDWLMGSMNTASGIALLLGSAAQTKHISPLLCGWVGMAGLVFTLHFGAFKLLALVWRSAGVNARPLMLAPIRATSLADFWGRRWNTAFSDPARRHIFEPLSKRIGTAPASLAVFVVSGLLHELVISIPAGGGYGWPTVYFLWQAIGMSFERSRAGRRFRQGHGRRGWLFVVIFTAGPVFWLFHPPFVLRVMFPFLEFVNQMKGVLS